MGVTDLCEKELDVGMKGQRKRGVLQKKHKYLKFKERKKEKGRARKIKKVKETEEHIKTFKER